MQYVVTKEEYYIVSLRDWARAMLVVAHWTLRRAHVYLWGTIVV